MLNVTLSGKLFQESFQILMSTNLFFLFFFPFYFVLLGWLVFVCGFVLTRTRWRVKQGSWTVAADSAKREH